MHKRYRTSQLIDPGPAREGARVANDHSYAWEAYGAHDQQEHRAPTHGDEGDGSTIGDKEDMAVVHRVYEHAAGGRTDREVGAATGLALKHLAEILTHPFPGTNHPKG